MKPSEIEHFLDSYNRGLKRGRRDSKRRVFYHVTDRENLESILRRGLLPSSPKLRETPGLGIVWGDHPEDVEGKISLGRSKKEVYDQVRCTRVMKGGVPTWSNVVLLKVTFPEYYEVGLEEEGDTDLLYVEKAIPPEFIEVVKGG